MPPGGAAFLQKKLLLHLAILTTQQTHPQIFDSILNTLMAACLQQVISLRILKVLQAQQSPCLQLISQIPLLEMLHHSLLLLGLKELQQPLRRRR